MRQAAGNLWQRRRRAAGSRGYLQRRDRERAVVDEGEVEAGVGEHVPQRVLRLEVAIDRLRLAALDNPEVEQQLQIRLAAELIQRDRGLARADMKFQRGRGR